MSSAPTKMSRELKEAVMAAVSKFGEDGKGKGGLKGFLVKLAREEPSHMAMLLLASLESIKTRPPV